LLGLDGSMANLDLAAPSTAILPKLRFSCPFAGLQAQLQPVAEIVQCGEPISQSLSATRFLNNLPDDRYGLTGRSRTVAIRRHSVDGFQRDEKWGPLTNAELQFYDARKADKHWHGNVADLQRTY
jgi:hypothetical protein